MKTNEKIICIFGTGGCGRETLLCLINKIALTKLKIGEIAVFMVDDDYYTKPVIMGVPVIKSSTFSAEKYQVVVAIGDPYVRRKIVGKLPPETEYITIIDPNAIISEWVEIGVGSIITAGTILTCNIKIGKHSHLNLNTTIAHDCKIGNFFTTAPAVNISGNCDFGDSVYFGTNSSAKQGVKICDNVTIGMGGVVVKNIVESGVYIGNPARPFRTEGASTARPARLNNPN